MSETMQQIEMWGNLAVTFAGLSVFFAILSILALIVSYYQSHRKE